VVSWEAWASLKDTARLLGLVRNTFLLVAGVLALVLPLGVSAAVLLYRTDLPGRNVLRFLVLLTLFVPLPLFTSGWQTVLGSGGWLTLPVWNPAPTSAPAIPGTQSVPPRPLWTPWGQGLFSAIWIHAAAGLPWVILIVGHGLSWVERELEEDALTVANPCRVLWHVTLPRARPALGVAALWVGLQAANEITVTDVMQVRSFAEEVYTQMVVPDPGANPETRALAISFPAVLAMLALVLYVVPRWERTIPPPASYLHPPLLFSLRWARFPALLLLSLLTFFLLGVPLASLVWRAGLHGTPPGWTHEQSPAIVWQYVRSAWNTEAGLILRSGLLALGAGVFCASLALLSGWLALGTPWLRYLLLILVALAWAMPGPVVGLGLKDSINTLLDLTGSDLLARWLYLGPSLVPVFWVYILRFFPYALAILWPGLRMIPRELFETAHLDGASPGQELWHLTFPLTARTFCLAALVVAVLALGELSASTPVYTPGADTYTIRLFTQMHYGITNNLAARCLLLLALVVAIGSVSSWLSGFGQNTNPTRQPRG
jgi:iron(III) transport system permease protein